MSQLGDVDLPDSKKRLLSQVDDIMREMDQRSKKTKGDAAPALALQDAAPALPKDDDETAVPATLEEWNTDTEWDVGTPEGYIGFITTSFPKAKRSQVETIALFYVKTELQSKATKSQPLYQLFQIKLAAPGTLQSPAGRASWLAAWTSNRSKQYCKVPKNQKK